MFSQRQELFVWGARQSVTSLSHVTIVECLNSESSPADSDGDVVTLNEHALETHFGETCKLVESNATYENESDESDSEMDSESKELLVDKEKSKVESVIVTENTSKGMEVKPDLNTLTETIGLDFEEAYPSISDFEDEENEPTNQKHSTNISDNSKLKSDEGLDKHNSENNSSNSIEVSQESVVENLVNEAALKDSSKGTEKLDDSVKSDKISQSISSEDDAKSRFYDSLTDEQTETLVKRRNYSVLHHRVDVHTDTDCAIKPEAVEHEVKSSETEIKENAIVAGETINDLKEITREKVLNCDVTTEIEKSDITETDCDVKGLEQSDKHIKEFENMEDAMPKESTHLDHSDTDADCDVNLSEHSDTNNEELENMEDAMEEVNNHLVDHSDTLGVVETAKERSDSPTDSNDVSANSELEKVNKSIVGTNGFVDCVPNEDNIRHAIKDEKENTVLPVVSETCVDDEALESLDNGVTDTCDEKTSESEVNLESLSEFGEPVSVTEEDGVKSEDELQKEYSDIESIAKTKHRSMLSSDPGKYESEIETEDEGVSIASIAPCINCLDVGSRVEGDVRGNASLVRCEECIEKFKKYRMFGGMKEYKEVIDFGDPDRQRHQSAADTDGAAEAGDTTDTDELPYLTQTGAITTDSSMSKYWTKAIDGLNDLTLYVQCHSDISLLLLLDKSEQWDESLLHSLVSLTGDHFYHVLLLSYERMEFLACK